MMKRRQLISECERLAGSFLPNVIITHHLRPMKKLRGLYRLLTSDHQVTIATLDIDLLLIDGHAAKWSDLELCN